MKFLYNFLFLLKYILWMGSIHGLLLLIWIWFKPHDNGVRKTVQRYFLLKSCVFTSNIKQSFVHIPSQTFKEGRQTSHLFENCKLLIIFLYSIHHAHLMSQLSNEWTWSPIEFNITLSTNHSYMTHLLLS